MSWREDNRGRGQKPQPKKNNNNNNNNNTVLVPRGGGESHFPAIPPRALRDGRKGDPLHKCCGKKGGISKTCLLFSFTFVHVCYLNAKYVVFVNFEFIYRFWLSYRVGNISISMGKISF